MNFTVVQIEKGNFHIFTNVGLNGRECRFLIDTGASRCVVDETIAKEIVLDDTIKEIASKTSGLHTTEDKSSFTNFDQFDVCGLKLIDHKVAVINLDHINSTYAENGVEPIDGIIGSDILVDYGGIIDYNKKELRFNSLT